MCISLAPDFKKGSWTGSILWADVWGEAFLRGIPLPESNAYVSKVLSYATRAGRLGSPNSRIYID